VNRYVGAEAPPHKDPDRVGTRGADGFARGPSDRAAKGKVTCSRLAGCTGHIGKYTNPRPNISSLSRVRRRRVEPANNLLDTRIKDDVFAGRTRL
jgi:hypothetical protein